MSNKKNDGVEFRSDKVHTYQSKTKDVEYLKSNTRPDGKPARQDREGETLEVRKKNR